MAADDGTQPDAEPTTECELLERIRELPIRYGRDPRPTVHQVSHELQLRADPARVVPGGGITLPWSDAARVRGRAREAAFEARLDIFRDDLRAIRIANEVLNRASTMRAVEAAETAIFEIRTIGETTRLAIGNRAQLEMTRQFVEQLDAIERFRGRLTPEIVDALKERALNEFTDRMNRASKADVEFNRTELLKVRP